MKVGRQRAGEVVVGDAEVLYVGPFQHRLRKVTAEGVILEVRERQQTKMLELHWNGARVTIFVKFEAVRKPFRKRVSNYETRREGARDEHLDR